MKFNGILVSLKWLHLQSMWVKLVSWVRKLERMGSYRQAHTYLQTKGMSTSLGNYIKLKERSYWGRKKHLKFIKVNFPANFHGACLHFWTAGFWRAQEKSPWNKPLVLFGPDRLVDCLQDFGPADWQLSCLICKTLWNYSESTTSAASCFGGDTNTLLVLLTALLGETPSLGLFASVKEMEGAKSKQD